MSNLERMIRDGSLVELISGIGCPYAPCPREFPTCEECWKAYFDEEAKP